MRVSFGQHKKLGEEMFTFAEMMKIHPEGIANHISSVNITALNRMVDRNLKATVICIEDGNID